MQPDQPALFTGKWVDAESTRCIPAENEERDIPQSVLPSDADELLRILEKAEVRGMGGGGFPSARKIRRFLENQDKEKSEGLLIVNAVECDPGLIHDSCLVTRYTEELEQTVELLRGILPLQNIILALSGHTSEPAVGGMDVQRVPNLYPAGEERILIGQVLGRKIPAGEYPADHGILVLNVQTMLQINKAWRTSGDSRKTTRQWLSLMNLKTREALAVEADSGTSVQNLVNRFFPGEKDVFVGGGAMQCRRAHSGEKVTPALNFIGISREPSYPGRSCRGCMKCVRHCPAGLDVKNIVQRKKDQTAAGADMEAKLRCLGCAACTYVCPAGINLAGIMAE